MQKIFRYRKFIGLTVSILFFLLNFPPNSARAAMIATEYLQYQDSELLADRAQLRAFLGRAEVMAQMQAYGISHEEALARVASLTDKEIASLAGKMDQISKVAGDTNEFDGSLMAIIGLALYFIFMAIAIYFSRTAQPENKPEEKEAEPAQVSELGLSYDNTLENRQELR